MTVHVVTDDDKVLRGIRSIIEPGTAIEQRPALELIPTAGVQTDDYVIAAMIGAPDARWMDNLTQLTEELLASGMKRTPLVITAMNHHQFLAAAGALLRVAAPSSLLDKKWRVKQSRRVGHRFGL